MDKETEETFKAVTTAGILGSMAGAIRFLLVNDEPPTQRIRTLFAGVMMAMIVGYAIRHLDINDVWRTLAIGGASAFVASYWTILENGVKKLVSKWIQKKTNDVSGPDDN